MSKVYNIQESKFKNNNKQTIRIQNRQQDKYENFQVNKQQTTLYLQLDKTIMFTLPSSPYTQQSIQSNITFLKQQIQKSKTLQKTYRLKLQTLTSIRQKTASQIQSLTKNYVKQIKTLEQKVKKLETQNSKLKKQNNLYEMEIQTFQERILEKEKMLSKILAKQFVVYPSVVSMANSRDTKNNQNTLGGSEQQIPERNRFNKIQPQTNKATQIQFHNQNYQNQQQPQAAEKRLNFDERQPEQMLINNNNQQSNYQSIKSIQSPHFGFSQMPKHTFSMEVDEIVVPIQVKQTIIEAKDNRNVEQTNQQVTQTIQRPSFTSGKAKKIFPPNRNNNPSKNVTKKPPQQVFNKKPSHNNNKHFINRYPMNQYQQQPQEQRKQVNQYESQKVLEENQNKNQQIREQNREVEKQETYFQRVDKNPNCQQAVQQIQNVPVTLEGQEPLPSRFHQTEDQITTTNIPEPQTQQQVVIISQFNRPPPPPPSNKLQKKPNTRVPGHSKKPYRIHQQPSQPTFLPTQQESYTQQVINTTISNHQQINNFPQNTQLQTELNPVENTQKALQPPHHHQEQQNLNNISITSSNQPRSTKRGKRAKNPPTISLVNFQQQQQKTQHHAINNEQYVKKSNQVGLAHTIQPSNQLQQYQYQQQTQNNVNTNWNDGDNNINGDFNQNNENINNENFFEQLSENSNYYGHTNNGKRKYSNDEQHQKIVKKQKLDRLTQRQQDNVGEIVYPRSKTTQFNSNLPYHEEENIHECFVDQSSIEHLQDNSMISNSMFPQDGTHENDQYQSHGQQFFATMSGVHSPNYKRPINEDNVVLSASKPKNNQHNSIQQQNYSRAQSVKGVYNQTNSSFQNIVNAAQVIPNNKRMQKKKGKRQNISIMDPSSFV